ncbi:MAG: KipI antagonist, partial [Nitrospiraceae bacterium]
GGSRLQTDSMLIGHTVPVNARPSYSSSPTLRVVLGPQADYFRDEALDTLGRAPYVVSPQADRMGYRLQGPSLTHVGTPDIVSDATPPGALQVPADRQPILLMADRQTTGGYPKIGIVITVDLPLAAQLMPGDTITFSLIETRDAQQLARIQRTVLDMALPPWPRD